MDVWIVIRGIWLVKRGEKSNDFCAKIVFVVARMNVIFKIFLLNLLGYGTNGSVHNKM